MINLKTDLQKKIRPQTLKGFRDFLPVEAIIRKSVIEKIKRVFEKFGFDPLETPSLEYAETLLGKYGEEADKLLYLFEDRGKRMVGLRYDQTVPLARVIAQYQNLPIPFKRYQIQPVWRAENTQKGRYREFLQCDIDTVGVKSLFSDAEIIVCVLETVKTLGFQNAKMLINDRAIFGNLDTKFIIALDKLQKIKKEGVIKELIEKGMKKDEAENFILSFENKKPTELLEKLFSILKKFNLKENKDFIFLPTLARGLDYYTGSIFELVCDDYPVGSLGGGGRYDNLIGKFTNKNIPAVGFAFGFDRLIEAMLQLKLFSPTPTSPKVLVAVFDQNCREESINLVNLLRKENINAEIILEDDLSLDKQLKYADKKGIPYVIIIGPEEKAKNTIKLKDMKTREQKEIPQSEISNLLLKLKII